jgi:DNA mismatch repair endonuclease MutH
MGNILERKVLLDSPTVKLAVERVERYQGKTLSEVADELEIPWTARLRNKGAGGLIGELILGLRNNILPLPDMQEVAVEVKYLPIYTDKFIPKEPTQITMIDYMGLVNQTWETALIRKKIARVFWVGYAVHRKCEKWVQTGYRILGWHLEIMPEQDLEVCGRDWRQIKEYVENGKARDLTCSMGVFIEPKPKGPGGDGMRPAPGYPAKPRGFYFKKAYTKSRIIPAIMDAHRGL